MKPAIFFITGTSGSGKSTVLKHLKKDLSFAKVYDFDEAGVPKNPDVNWRKQTTNEWLIKARKNINDGLTTIICGVTVPEEIKNSPEFDDSLNVYFGIIILSKEEIQQRLKARGWNNKLIEDNINWAQYLEECVTNEKNHFIVDGENNNPNQVAEKLAAWINGKIK